MKAGVAAAAALAFLTLSRLGSACACGVPGLESALTSPGDRWGVRLTQALSLGHGRWNASGNHRPLAADEHERRYELEALAALRLRARWELSASTSYAHTSLAEGGWSSSLSGLGDTTARARFEAIDETPPHRSGMPWPALALTASLRAPTAGATDAVNLGLGAYEIAVTPSLERSISARVRVGLSGLLAWRAPDHSLGASRQLGPRVTTQLTGWYWPRPNLALSLASNLDWEADTTYAGQRLAGSGSRKWQAAAGVSFRPDGSGLRSGLRVVHAPPLPAINANALGDTSIDLSLAYVR
jgi:hypothetical protein